MRVATKQMNKKAQDLAGNRTLLPFPGLRNQSGAENAKRETKKILKSGIKKKRAKTTVIYLQLLSLIQATCDPPEKSRDREEYGQQKHEIDLSPT